MLSQRSIPRALVLALLGVLTSLLVLPVPPASAETTILCRGFSDCNAKGMGNAGYQNYYRQMWWRMYSGHNCTNYAAYRMVKAGMSPTRPWEGSGNASNWGVELADRTDQTPMVGAIAWWRGRNHVQYVERVIDANTIVVSEDHWGGDFNWARIRRSSGDWPTGFIHLRDARIANVEMPSISGAPQVDQPVVASGGRWTPSARLAYQWYVEGEPIAGATSLAFTPGPNLVGKRVALRVVASRTGYVSLVRGTNRTAPVAPGEFSTTRLPTISGTPRMGATLTATNGSWSPRPGATPIQWFADGAAIPGATGWNLTLRAEQVEKRITAVVTPRRAGYETTPVSSAATEPVGPEDITITTPARLTGKPLLGQTLRLYPGAWRPSDASFTYTWLRDGVPIAGASGHTHTTTTQDLGTRINVRLQYAKPGYETQVRTLGSPYRVKSMPRVRMSSSSPRTITVRLTAPGVDTVRGEVRLRAPNGTVARGRLSGGQVTFSPSWLRVGTREYVAQYVGSLKVRHATLRKQQDVMGYRS